MLWYRLGKTMVRDDRVMQTGRPIEDEERRLWFCIVCKSTDFFFLHIGKMIQEYTSSLARLRSASSPLTGLLVH